MIDLHSHVLPGLDDGARDLDDALGIARSMSDDGVLVVAATPHVRVDYPTTPQQVEEAVGRLRAAIDVEGIPLDVRPGAEVALDMLETLDDATRARFGLGGNPRLLLIEFPYYGWPATLVHECLQLREKGVVPVIAHPERNHAVQERPGDIAALVNVGAVVQLTAASVDGRLGRATAACARRLLDLEVAHLLASDAHVPGVREAGLSGAVRAIDNRPLARWLTTAVPQALLAGDELPRRPVPSRSRRARWRPRR